MTEITTGTTEVVTAANGGAGIGTSEFKATGLASALVAVASIFGTEIDQETAVIIISSLVGLYTIGRSLVKAFGK